MSVQQARHGLMRSAELLSQYHLISAQRDRFQSLFEQQVADFQRLPTKKRRAMVAEMSDTWLKLRACVRLAVELEADYRRAMTELHSVLHLVGQQIGERLPSQYDVPKQDTLDL